MGELMFFTGLSSVVAFVIAILIIILFFKLWGMTNDIRDIKNKYMEDYRDSIYANKSTEDDNSTMFKIGDLVVCIETEKQMRVKEIDPQTGKFSCYTNGGMRHEGDFYEAELRKFE